MFFMSGEVSIFSKLDLASTADVVAKSLGVPRFVRDTSGRWEDDEVYLSECFGLEFMFCVPVNPQPNEYGLSINSSVEGLIYDGTEREIDVADYAAMLINRTKEVTARADPPPKP